MKNVFTEKTGEFSWRKGMTGVAVAVFATANIGYLVANKFAELPGSYQGIIAGVFIFYFGKRMFEGLKLSANDKGGQGISGPA